MKAVKAKYKIWKREQTKTLLIQFQLFVFYKRACLQKYFHGQVLSIRVFFSDRRYGLIVSLRMNTIAFRNQFKPIRMEENLVVNYKLG